MKSNFITVLNHIDGEVYQHKLPDFKFSTSDLESWLVHNGYSLNNVEWMVHEHPVVIDGDRDCECGETRDPNLCGSGCCKNTN
jgi:hypothetical protein